MNKNNMARPCDKQREYLYMKNSSKTIDIKKLTTPPNTKVIMEFLEIKKDANMTRIYSAIKCSDFFNTKTA